MVDRAHVVAVARSWIGTPFHHQATLKGVGVDCAGLIRGVAVELGLLDAAVIGEASYSRFPDGSMKPLCDRTLTPIEQGAVQPGDVLLFAIAEDPQHMGIVADYRWGGLSLIHAALRSDGKGRVQEQRLMFARNLKFVAAYALPGIE